MLHHLSQDTLTDQTAEQLYILLPLLSTCPLPLLTNLLSAIKSNDTEIKYTLIICRVLTSVLDNEQLEAFYETLARKTHDKFHKYQYVSMLLENYPSVRKPLYNILNEGNETNIAHINLANSVFIPILSSCDEDVVDELWSTILLILPYIDPDHQTAFVRLLLEAGGHKNKSVVSLIEHCWSDKETYMATSNVLPKTYITEYFYQAVSEKDSTPSYMIELCARALSLFPELSQYYRDLLGYVIENNIITKQQIVIFSEIDWSTLFMNVPDITDAIIKLPPILADIPSKYTTVVRHLIPCLPTPTKEQFLEQCFKEYLRDLTLENAEEIGKVISENLSHDYLDYLCQSRDGHVLFLKEISHMQYNHVLLLDMSERYNILILPNEEKHSFREEYQISQIVPMFSLYQSYFDHLSGLHITNFTDDILKNLALILYQLISLEYSLQVVVSPPVNVGVAFRVIIELESDILVYAVINEFIRNQNMIVIYFLKDLLAVNFDIQWVRVKGGYELGIDLVINLATNFKHQGFFEAIESDLLENKGFSVPEKLLALEFVTARHNCSDDLIEFITDYCLEIEQPSAALCGIMFRIFHALFVCPSITDSTIEFLLCSTATLIQNMLNAKVNLPFYEIYSAIKFTDFYLVLSRLLAVAKGSTESTVYSNFHEDWITFFEPGIQDLVLVYQDHLLDRIGEKETNIIVLRHIAEVSVRAPVSSIHTYFKHFLNIITFNASFNFIMAKYNLSVVLSYETQKALFALLAHAQNEFEFLDEKNNLNDEQQLFSSPSQIFLQHLDQITYDKADEERYQYCFARSAHIWCLMLQNESKKSPDILREHVSFLRTRSATFDFLSTLAKHLDFTVKKYKVQKINDLISDTSYAVADLAGTCLYYACDIYPALVRSWWKSLDKEYTIKIDKFISSFISPLLIAKETSITFEEDKFLQV